MEVIYDKELRRIEALPRRPQGWGTTDPVEACETLTEYLRAPGGTRTLLPIQALALVEAAQHRRFVGVLGPGSGKTLMYFLMPVVLNISRYLLLVPAKLRTKTVDEYHEWLEHFRLPYLHGTDVDPASVTEHRIHLQSYESLGHLNYAGFLSELQPGGIGADEAHALAHFSAGRTKRVMRYLTKENPECRFHPSSGTFWRKSLREAAHLFEAALEADNSPLPTTFSALDQWCAAVDEGVRGTGRIGVGALRKLIDPALDTDPSDPSVLQTARRAIQRRIADTPGVVVTTQPSCGLTLTLQHVPLQVPQNILDALAQLRTEYVRPDGQDAGEPLQMWAVARQLGSGFFYRHNPEPPKEWRLAHRKWNVFVRECLSNPGRLLLDTPLQVWNAVAEGKLGHVPEWEAWVAIKDTFTPHTEPYWVDDFAVKAAEDWALANNGIVWCGHTALDGEDDDVGGRGFTRIPYFGAGRGKELRGYKGPCAASIRSHGTGLNLQDRHKALIMNMPSSGATLEQLLARHHREGQKADVVEFYFFAHTKEIVTSLQTCFKDAKFMEATTSNPQRLFQAHLLDANDHRLTLETLEQQAI